jgi:hypothetical protein
LFNISEFFLNNKTILAKRLYFITSSCKSGFRSPNKTASAVERVSVTGKRLRCVAIAFHSMMLKNVRIRSVHAPIADAQNKSPISRNDDETIVQLEAAFDR